MPLYRLNIQIEGDNTEVLNVPYFAQPETNKFCYICSFLMILDYFKNIYPSQIINQNTPYLNFDELVKITKTHDGGTRTEDLVAHLEGSIPTLKFEIVRNGNFDMIRQSLENNIPIIIIYCGDYLYNHEIAGGHAGVVIGLTGNKIILNNPWIGYQVAFERAEFKDAWDIERNQFIRIKPALQERLMEDAND